MIRPMFIPMAVAKRGTILLQELIRELESAAIEHGDNWPDDFDPNDIGLYQSVLTSIASGVTSGYEEQYWWGKPFRFFMSSMQRHVHERGDIEADEAEAISQTLQEYQKRAAKLRMVNGCIEET